MKKDYVMRATTVIAATALLGACSSPMQEPVHSQPYPAVNPSPSYSSNYGVVESIQMVGSTGGSGGIGAGAVLGGVAGGVLGNQVGGGSGKTAATVAGTGGGAGGGHQNEQKNKTQTST